MFIPLKMVLIGIDPYPIRLLGDLRHFNLLYHLQPCLRRLRLQREELRLLLAAWTVDDRRPIGGSGSGGSPGPKNDGKMGICWWTLRNFDENGKICWWILRERSISKRLKQHEATTMGRWGLKLHQENVTNNKPKEYDQQQQLHEKANQSLSEWCLRAVWDELR